MSRRSIIALTAGVALGVLSISSAAVSFDGHGGLGGGHSGGSGGGHFGGFGGRQYGGPVGGHFGSLGGSHYGGLGGHFGGMGGRSLGGLAGGHSYAARQSYGGGARGWAGGKMAGRNLTAANLGGGAFAGRNFAPHGAWGQGHWGGGWGGRWGGYPYGFGWWGPVFWPFAFDTIFGYVFLPWAFYDPFWGYGPWDIYASTFWLPAPYWDDYGYPDAGLPVTYGDVYSGDVFGSGSYGRTRAAGASKQERTAKSRAATQGGPEGPADPSRMCSDRTQDLAGLPIDQIEQTVQPTGDEVANLDALKAAATKANEILAASCPNHIALTPPARLAAMESRLDSMRQVVETIQPALGTFYASLSDEQKARFDAMKVESGKQPKRGRTQAKQAVVTSADACGAQTAHSPAFPEQEIERAVHPTDDQRAALDELRTASAKGADMLKDTCPAHMPPTSVGRLAAVKTRLDAMLEVVRLERTAMDKFYGSLTDEQKAQFNAMRPPEPTGHQG